MESPLDVLIRAVAVTTTLTLVLALLPFHRECQPFARRLGWFYIRYVLPAYLIILAGEHLFGTR